MSRWIASLVLAVTACGSGDDTVDGARGQCATGGVLDECAPADQTPDGACWRLVDCAVIPVRSDANNRFDWGRCVDRIERLTADRQRILISCIASSQCDALKVEGSPDQPDIDQQACFIEVGQP